MELRAASCRRRADWLSGLSAYIDGIEPNRPFQWGVWDCMLHGANGVLAMTGVDYADGYRGQYSDLTGGLHVLERLGFDGPGAVLASLFPAVHLSRARRGDIAIVESQSAGAAVGIVIGAEISLVADRGLMVVDLTRATKVFAVG